MGSASTTVISTIRVPRDWFFFWFLSVDVPKIMHGYAILPGVVATRNQTGPIYEPGNSRELLFSDGSSAFEEILSSEPPKSLDYRVSRITSIFRHLVRDGRARITFDPSPAGGTVVQWHYTFYGHNWAASLLLKPMVAVFWSGFLRSTLARARDLAEAEAPRQSP